MHSLKSRALEGIMRTLTGFGWKFAIIDEDGVRHGNLLIVEPKPERPLKPRSIVFNNFEKYEYAERIDAAKPGDLVTFEIQPTQGKEPHDEAESLRGSVTSYAIRRFGKGSCMTELRKEGERFFVDFMLNWRDGGNPDASGA